MNYDKMVEDNPWGVVLLALAAEAEGKPLPSELRDAAWQAGAILAIGTLVQAGADFDATVRQFEERDFTVKFVYDGTEGTVTITVDWDDGESTIVAPYESR